MWVNISCPLGCKNNKLSERGWFLVSDELKTALGKHKFIKIFLRDCREKEAERRSGKQGEVCSHFAFLLSLYYRDVASVYISDWEKLQLVSLPGLWFSFLADTEQTGPHHTYTLLRTVLKKQAVSCKISHLSACHLKYNIDIVKNLFNCIATLSWVLALKNLPGNV